jgi:transcription antitermination factor NusA-like protein
MVVKAIPDYDSYLTMIPKTGFMPLLPKKYATRKYRIGDSLIASVHAINDGRIIITQRSAQFYRKLTEFFLTPLIREGRIKVRRAATLRNAPFVKVSVEGLNNEDPVRISLPYLRDLKQYIDQTVTLVEYSPDLREYVINSLAPAPRNGVRKVILFKELREALVRVDPGYLGLFLGKGGLNVALASKLLKIKIKIEKEE